MNGLVKRFLPAPYVAGGRFARMREKPTRMESRLDRCTGTNTNVAFGARVRRVSRSPLDGDVSFQIPQAAEAVAQVLRVQQRRQPGRQDAGGEGVHPGIEVPDDVGGEVLHQLAHPGFLLGPGHPPQRPRHLPPVRRFALAAGVLGLLVALDLVVRDVVEDVFQGGVGVALAGEDLRTPDAPRHLPDDVVTFGVEVENSCTRRSFHGAKTNPTPPAAGSVGPRRTCLPSLQASGERRVPCRGGLQETLCQQGKVSRELPSPNPT